jgi:hypothetical protein
LHNEKLQDLYSSKNKIQLIISKTTRLVGHVARMGEKINACRALAENLKVKRPIGRPRRR